MFELKKTKDGWWVTENGDEFMGPYSTKAAAESDRIGTQRFLAADAKGGKRAEAFVHGAKIDR